MCNFTYDISKTHTSIILSIVDGVNCKLYLELGVFTGINIHEIRKVCNNCIGVDIYDQLIHNDFEMHTTSTDNFFKTFNKNPDVIFIDADHIVEQVKKDFKNSLNCLNKNGVIILHDTDPYTKEFLSSEYCGDSYKMHDWIKENYPELNIITLPIGFTGLTIVNRNNDRRVLNFL